jgi:thiol-disulfide isomerase/thioredoxin
MTARQPRTTLAHAFRRLMPARLLVLLALLGPLGLLPAQPLSTAEQTSLADALGEAGNSQIDFLHALENHLAKFPNSPKRAELERALVKSAIELKDAPRIIRYGERVLQREPDDLQIVEAAAIALMQTGEKPNLERALKHAEHFLQIVRGDETGKDLTGRDAARRKEQHERAEARGDLLVARAHGLLGHTDRAIEFAEKSYKLFASVESARESARWLDQGGKAEQAIQYLADAFTISGLQASNADAKNDREKMGELYRKLNGSEKGLGDVILKAYDHTAAELAAHREQLRQTDPNAQLKDPMQFTITGLTGAKLPLPSLKGKVIVMDFWATWCGPCRAQHPLYEEVKKRFKGRDDVVFLAIATDDDHSLVKPFLEQNNWSQNVYFEDGLSQLLQVSSIPTTLIVDKQGAVFSRMAGFIPERFVDMLTDRIHEALGEKPAIQASNQ